jgi:hypothetical protein
MTKSLALPSLLAIVALAIPTAACSFESEARGRTSPLRIGRCAQPCATASPASIERQRSGRHPGRPRFLGPGRGPSAELDQLRVARDGDKLLIGLKKGVHWGKRSGVR